LNNFFIAGRSLFIERPVVDLTHLDLEKISKGE